MTPPPDASREGLVARLETMLMEEDRFPIMLDYSHGKWYLPMSLFRPHEEQARRNHDQTLDRLRERGGLSPCEALAVLEDRPWRRIDRDRNDVTAMVKLVALATARLVLCDALAGQVERPATPAGTAPTWFDCAHCGVSKALEDGDVVCRRCWERERPAPPAHASHEEER